MMALKKILEGYKGTIEENNNELTRLNHLILELQNELEKPEAVEDDDLQEILKRYKDIIEENNNELTRLNNLILELQNELENP